MKSRNLVQLWLAMLLILGYIDSIGASPNRQQAQVSTIQWSVDGDALFIFDNDELCKYEISGISSSVLILDSQQARSINNVVISDKHDLLVVGYSDGKIDFWDFKSRTLETSIQAHEGVVSSLALSHDGNSLASSSFDEIKIWEIESQKLLWEIESQIELGIRDITFDPSDKKLGILSGIVFLYLWEFGENWATPIVGPPHGPITIDTLSFHPHENFAVTAGEFLDSLIFWNTQELSSFIIRNHHRGGSYNAEFSPDGSYVASAEETTLMLFEITITEDNQIEYVSEKELYAGISIQNIAFNPDGSLLASTGHGITQVWDVQKGKAIMLWEGCGNEALPNATP